MRYTLFAFLAILANLLTQRLALLAGNTTGHLAFAIASGTIVGLIIKYLLDKRWIFYDNSIGLKAHGRTFMLYTAMGLVTTAIFWTTETAFWLILQTDKMRELGAVLGLAVGYWAKYHLDRRFVFTDAHLRAME